MKRILATTLILFTTASLFAQGTENLDTAVVSSSQIPQTVRESGRNITIITAKDIQAIPATSLDEILQTVTGLEVQSRGGFGVQGDILMRGATFTQVLVLIDGMKMNDPLTGHFNSYIPVSPAEIERIEILRGAAAAMYGADAVGGVINVITRTFSDRTYPNGAIITGNFNRGNHQLTSTQQGFHYTNGRTMIGAGILMNQSEGESFPARILDTSTTLSAYNNHFDVRTLGASFSHRFQRGYSIHIRSSYDFRDFGARYFYTTSPFDKSEETVSNYWNQLRVAKQWKQGVTDLNISHKYNTDEFVFSPDFPSTNNHISRYTNLIVNHLYSINSQLKLKLGVQADQRSIESNDRGTHDDFHTGLYGMTHYRTDDWSVSVSARADYDNNYGLEFTPQVNAARIYDKWVIRASAGRVIRAADYTERYVSNNLLNLTPGRSLGNPDLVAESGWSEELGFNFQPNTQWMFKGTAFARQSANLIDYALTNQRVIGSVSETGSLVD
ncbi:MAG: TonB-dependent receptor, partial [Bacteroidetes bacterium]|nr:TonB-dependent receptor [Bacteroidota bacterium]